MWAQLVSLGAIWHTVGTNSVPVRLSTVPGLGTLLSSVKMQGVCPKQLWKVHRPWAREMYSFRGLRRQSYAWTLSQEMHGVSVDGKFGLFLVLGRGQIVQSHPLTWGHALNGNSLCTDNDDVDRFKTHVKQNKTIDYMDNMEYIYICI